MIPLVMRIAGGAYVLTVGLAYGATIGSGLGTGRRWGKKACNMLDAVEEKVSTFVDNITE